MYLPALAQDTPMPPLNLKAEIITKPGIDIQYVRLTWDANPNGVTPDYYLIYMSAGETKDPNNFKITYKVKTDPSLSMYEYLISNLKTGTYSFFVTAGKFSNNLLIESNPSEIINIKVDNGNGEQKEYIRINNIPPLTGTAGREYVWQIEWESNVNCPIFFNAALEPDNDFYIDNNGLFKFTPQSSGTYLIRVTASLDCIGKVSVTSTYKIMIDGEPPVFDCAITGTVKGIDGELIPSGTLQAWSKNANSKDPGNGNYFKSVIQNGKFELEVPEGEYLLMFQ
jgi:hypothetical protein